MAACFLGVDTGATKSEALLCDGRGRALGNGRAGAGNWETVGWDGTRAVLDDIIGQAVRAAGIRVADITASGLGLAGNDWPEDHAPHEALLRDMGLRGPMKLVNDAFLGLVAGAEAGWGVVISAGTSCNCYGRDVAGRIGRMTGNSPFGEYAGAVELVQYAVQAVARAWTMRGPRTDLSHVLVEAVGAAGVEDLLAGLVRGRYRLGAEHAPRIFAAAAGGDAVAGDAVEWAGHGLADLALGVIRQLDLGEETFEVVLSGSFFRGSPRLAEIIGETMAGPAPGAQVVPLMAPPVAGGVLLAMEAAGPISPAARETVIASAASFSR